MLILYQNWYKKNYFSGKYEFVRLHWNSIISLLIFSAFELHNSIVKKKSKNDRSRVDLGDDLDIS